MAESPHSRCRLRQTRGGLRRHRGNWPPQTWDASPAAPTVNDTVRLASRDLLTTVLSWLWKSAVAGSLDRPDDLRQPRETESRHDVERDARAGAEYDRPTVGRDRHDA